MGNVIKSFGCSDWAKYVFNSATFHSQCCDDEDLCNCDFKTTETPLASVEGDQELEMSIGNDSMCHGLCCNCLLKTHNK